MCVAASIDGDRRRAKKPIIVCLPTSPAQHGTARRGKRREVAHRCAGDETDRRFLRQVKNVEQPACRRFLNRCRRGGGRMKGRVLSPCAGQPVGGDADW